MLWTQIDLSNLVDEHHKLVQAIYDYDYFVSTFERAQDSFELDVSVPEHICSFWNHFWYMLPDNAIIQRDPFSRICDMAQGDYLDE